MTESISWPLDEAGKPTAKVLFFVRDLIGLENYSNVTISGSVETFTDNSDEGIKSEFRRHAGLIEEVLGEERDKIMAALDSSGGE